MCKVGRVSIPYVIYFRFWGAESRILEDTHVWEVDYSSTLRQPFARLSNTFGSLSITCAHSLFVVQFSSSQ